MAGAAVLRFATLDVQSFSNDEAFTVAIVNGGLGSVWDAVKSTESTPPLFYYLAWAWAQVFGDGEVGLRLLPALLGTLLVPATWAAARATLPDRAALIAAALVALSPLLIWYSQEARAYALLALLATLGYLFFVRALERGATRDLAFWAVLSALALATHYFAVFPVAAEALWLVWTRRDARALAAAALPALAGAALLPLLLHQEEHVPRAWTELFTLSDQLRGFVQQAAVGPRWTWLVQRPGVFAIGALAALGVVLLLWRASERERRGAAPAAVIALATVAPPILLSLAGDNLVATRNLIAAWPLAAIVVAAGLASVRRAGALAAAALCAVMLAIDVAVPLEERLQRDDWRALMERAGSAQAVAVVRAFENGRVARLYLRDAPPPPGGATVRARELVMVGDPRSGAAAFTAPPAAGFALAGEAREGDLALARFTAPQPVALPAAGFHEVADVVAAR